MRYLLALALLAACSASPPEAFDPIVPATKLCAQRFRYPGGDLRAIKPRGSTLHPFTLGSQGTTCGATIAEDWDGIDSTHSSCGCNPPDGSIAVGPSHVVSVVNTAMEVWNKTGTVLSGPSNLQTLMTPTGDTLPDFSDPGVLYDATADRYVIYIMNFNSAETSSTLNVAVSTTNDPTGSWTLYAFTMPYLLDFPHGAINAPSGSDEVLYVGGNLFNGPSTFVNAYVVALDLTSMYAGTTPTPVVHNVGNNASGVTADTLMPAQNDSASGVMYFLSADNQRVGNSKISLFRWADPFNTDSFALQGGVTVASYVLPPNAFEPNDGANGTVYVDTNDARELATVYYSGSLYGAHSVGVIAGGAATAGVQWYEIGNIDSTPTLTQQGTNATADAYRWMPAMAVDGSGDLAMSYSYTNGGYVGTRFTARYAGTTSGTILGESDLVDGSSYALDTSRWGDFGTMVYDGTDFWTVGEYENGVSHGGWNTHVNAISLGTSAAFDLAVTPSYQDTIRAQNTSYTVAAHSCNGYSRTINMSAPTLPTGATASFSPTSISGTGSSTMTFHPASTTPLGLATLGVKGTDSGGSPIETSAEAIANVVASDFSVSVSPTSATVTRGNKATFTVTFTSVGFAGNVYTYADGAPGGLAQWTTDPVTLRSNHSTNDTWSIGVGSNDPTGVYQIWVGGIGGVNDALHHAASIQLTVN